MLAHRDRGAVVIRALALGTMLLGAMAYLYPQFRAATSFDIIITDDNSHLLGFILVAIGILLLVVKRRG